LNEIEAAAPKSLLAEF